MLLTILLNSLISWTLYGNIATFYPIYTSDNHPSVTSTMVGAVLGIFEFSILICSPLVAISMRKVGRKNYVVIGNLAIVLSTLGFGLTNHISNDTLFFLTSLSCRFLQGFGDAASSTAVLSIIGNAYPDKRDLYFGYQETAVGIGLMAGPVLGNFLYSSLGYSGTFYCSALLVILTLVAL